MLLSLGDQCGSVRYIRMMFFHSRVSRLFVTFISELKCSLIAIKIVFFSVSLGIIKFIEQHCHIFVPMFCTLLLLSLSLNIVFCTSRCCSGNDMYFRALV